MKITDFTKKKKFISTDSLIGYDKSGNPIRITLTDLATSLGVTTVKAESVTVQYSLDKSTWHTPFSEGDRYMRVKCGSGEWSNSICISVSAYETWLEKNGGKGSVEDFLAAIKGEPGDSVDVSQLKLSEMGDYKELLSTIGDSIAEQISLYENRIAALEKKLSELEGK
ncbi:MAG: hypothetical protein II894_03265 [Bacteroidales bacterium]|nr:hypothetical protein [Bacteroidales bacterium]